MIVGVGSAVIALLLLDVPVSATKPLVEVKVTQRYLEPVCLDAAPVEPGKRHWKLDVGAHSLAFTMHSDPRQPFDPHQRIDPGTGPGVAEVSFALEAGHTYEVEVRAPATAFSARAWTRGEWKPVVRDRTVDRVISGEPRWIESDCRRRAGDAERETIPADPQPPETP